MTVRVYHFDPRHNIFFQKNRFTGMGKFATCSYTVVSKKLYKFQSVELRKLSVFGGQLNITKQGSHALWCVAVFLVRI